MTPEMITSTNDKKKKKDLALEDSNTNDDDEDEEMAFLSRKFRRFLTNKKEGTLKLQEMILMIILLCYKCRKLRYMIANCLF